MGHDRVVCIPIFLLSTDTINHSFRRQKNHLRVVLVHKQKKHKKEEKKSILQSLAWPWPHDDDDYDDMVIRSFPWFREIEDRSSDRRCSRMRRIAPAVRAYAEDPRARRWREP